MVVILMTYFDRQQQLDRTLYSIADYKDIKIIIVDDCSPVPPVINSKLDIEVLKVEDKKWIMAGPAYNIGISKALEYNPEVIIIQNPECVYIGDVIGYSKRVTDETYISFGCYNLSRERTPITDVQATNNDMNGWLNNKSIQGREFHWCSAITPYNLKRLNGFDERFANGYWYDDNEFLARVQMLGLKVIVTDYPYVVHQWHNRNYAPENKDELIQRNADLYSQILREGNPVATHLYTKDI